jgi:Domain of unknown function (DUF4439)
MSRLRSTQTLRALQSTLAAEHAAVYLYAALGARVSASVDPQLAARLRSAYGQHRGRRDQLTAMVQQAHARPVAAAVSYRLPNPSRTSRQLTAGALQVETRCEAVYADMVAGTSGVSRQWAIEALSESAVRALGFGGGPVPFPGVPEL